MGRFCVIFSIAFVISFSTTAARAQTNEEAFEQLQWQFAIPGARAQAMGGGLIAEVDDPTGILTNPAGLVRSGGTQFTVEFRNADLRVNRLATVDALLTASPTTYRDSMNELAFVGVALPLRPNRLVVAFARHEVLDYRSSFHVGPRVLPGLPASARAYTPVMSDIDFRAATYAIAISAAVRKDVFLGLTLSADRFRATATNTRYDYVAGATRFDLVDSPVITNRSTIDDRDWGTGILVGAMYRPGRAITLGAAYSRRPAFTVAEDYQLNMGNASGLNGPFVTQAGFPAAISVKIPDQLNGGLSWRASRRLLLAVDVAHITYSEMADDLTPIRAHDFVTSADFRVSDVTEFHFGSEFTVGSDSTPVLLRAGVFTNPNHRIEFVGNVQPGATITVAQAQRANAIERSVFNLGPHDDDVRGTLGAGMALGRHASVDAAYVWKQQLVIGVSGRF